MILMFLPFWIRLSIRLIPVKKTDKILIERLVLSRKKTFKFGNLLLRVVEIVRKNGRASRAQRIGLLRAIKNG